MGRRNGVKSNVEDVHQGQPIQGGEEVAHVTFAP
jgi:hypothetical protein